ncbi:hypothetical protein HHI36_013881 [Cryptolaemus montrouzieri]|uniref:Uncharacterized protein n=1 Tax=Cryptolaemus montrouzieri TaxID=559131 RepID=A0ABD2N1N8_9CUCU
MCILYCNYSSESVLIRCYFRSRVCENIKKMIQVDELPWANLEVVSLKKTPYHIIDRMVSDFMGNPIQVILWLIILIVLSFWFAGICAFFYIIVYCLEACIPGLKDISDLLLQGVQLPNLCAKKVIEGLS